MLQAYSLNVEVAADTAIPFNSASANKGCADVLVSPTTIELNKRGVYLVMFNSSLEAATTVQLTKDGVAQPQAQSTGTNPNFSTLVQVDRDTCGCCCSSPTTLQIKNTGDAAATFIDCNVVVIKLSCS